MSAEPIFTRTASALDRLSGHLRGELASAPIMELIGFRLTAADEGSATVELQAGPQHANLNGTMHGGVLCDTADAAMGIDYATTLAEGESFTTVDLKINFLKPAWNGKLVAIGRVVKRGRTLGLVECDVLNQGGSLVARASSTCMTLKGKEAEGR